MASTYSSYKIELIGTGEQSGTWGNTTNNNFQYAIEQAIGGYATVSINTTPYALTLTDTNALQDARALFIKFNSTLGADATVTLPSIQKLYFLYNNTGYNLTAKTVTTPSITIPNGNTACVYINGTDLVGTPNYFTSIRTSAGAVIGSTLSVTGAVTASDGASFGSSIALTPATWNFSATNVVQVNYNSHGLSAGDVVTINFGTGTGTVPPTAQYTILGTPNAPTANSFYVAAVGTTGSGSAATIYKSSTFTLNSQLYVSGSSGTSGQFLISQGTDRPPQWATLSSVTGNLAIGGSLTVTGASTFNGNTTVGSTTVTSGTYGRSGTNVTVTSNSHGFSNGQVLYLAFSAGTGGTATSGVYTISNVATNTFDVTDTASGTITGAPAVSITKYNNTTTLQTPLSSFGSVGTSGFLLASQGADAPPKWVDGVSKLTNSSTQLSVDSSGNFVSRLSTSTPATPDANYYPAFFQRAWVNFNATSYTTVTTNVGAGEGYTWSGTTITVNKNNHGFVVGDIVYLNFTTGGGAVNAYRTFYRVLTATTNQFTTSGASLAATSGSVSWYLANISASGNIRRISVGTQGAVIGTINSFAVMFTTEMPDTNYAWSGSVGQSSGTQALWLSNLSGAAISNWKTKTALNLGIYYAYNAYVTNTPEDVSLMITR